MPESVHGKLDFFGFADHPLHAPALPENGRHHDRARREREAWNLTEISVIVMDDFHVIAQPQASLPKRNSPVKSARHILAFAEIP